MGSGLDEQPLRQRFLVKREFVSDRRISSLGLIYKAARHVAPRLSSGARGCWNERRLPMVPFTRLALRKSWSKRVTNPSRSNEMEGGRAGD
jgi:hypothetical protein